MKKANCISLYNKIYKHTILSCNRSPPFFSLKKPIRLLAQQDLFQPLTAGLGHKQGFNNNQVVLGGAERLKTRN